MMYQLLSLLLTLLITIIELKYEPWELYALYL